MGALSGFLAPTEPLSPRTAFTRADALVQLLAVYDPATLWEQDTATLPGALQRHRRRVRAFADAELRPRALQADTNAHAGGDVAAVLAAAGRAGLLSDFLAWPLGSVPWTLAARPITMTNALKMEELCAACGGLGLAIGAPSLGAAPLLFSGEWSSIFRHLIPRYRACEAGDPRVFGFAITEPAAGSDVEESHGAKHYKPGTVAARVPGGWKLNGRKVFISGGDLADAVTVFAALAGEGMESWTCFVVERGMPGFASPRTEHKMGQRASGAAELVFEDVCVPDSHVVGGLRNGWAINRLVLNSSRLPVAAIALGIARGAMESALSFARAQTLGGKMLLDYQDVQLAVAQMFLDVQAMRAIVWQSAAHWKPTQARASMAKVFCGDTAVRVCENAMELMGNQGLRHANRAEKAFRDARLTQIYEGTNQINRLAVIEDQMEELLAQAPPVEEAVS
jgi:butyryl-CoA dehydrogenase